MSLHRLATHMQSQGRDGDTGLIHMSPAEINGLQHLAIARGGSLTINPKTGLPEASFLKDWLPVIIGGLAAPFTGGMSLAATMAISGALAAGTSLAVGNSLNKSLLQGLTAGAGAGIGGALGAAGGEAAGAGANAASKVAPVATNVATQTATQQATQQATQLAVRQAAQKALADQGLKGAVGATQRAAATAGGDMWGNVGQFAGKSIAPMVDDAAQLTTRGGLNAPEQTFLGVGTPYASPASFAPKAPTPTGAEIYKAAGPMERLSHMNKGVDRLFNEEGFAGDFASANKGKLFSLGTGAIGSSSMSDPYRPAPEVSTYKGPYLPTERIAQFPTGPEPWTDTSERQYFDDVNPYPGVVPYEPTKAAVGGLMGVAGDSYDDEAGHDGYADGGKVDQNKMAAPDMRAIQQYVQSISQPQRPQGQPSGKGGASGAQPAPVDPYATYGGPARRPQVPEILMQLQAQQSTQGQPSGKGGASGAQPAPVDPYATYGEHDYGFKPITVQGAVAGKYANLSKHIYNPETQQMELPEEVPMAMGGLTSLARGGSYLDGPGDGLSDSIPAMIGKNQPARLADGEFVISADVVSAIGGGSSKAGARKLHAMMDRVRQSAHGTKKQVKKINDRKVLAA